MRTRAATGRVAGRVAGRRAAVRSGRWETWSRAAGQIAEGVLLAGCIVLIGWLPALLGAAGK